MGNYEARITLENGLILSEKFDDYADMCRWLALNGEAGIAAYDIDAGAPIDQAQLQQDVTAYQG